VKNKSLLFLCPSYPSVGGVESVTCLLIDFFMDQGYRVSILVSKTGVKTGGILDKHSGLMFQMEGKPNSQDNLDFIDRFIDDNDIACVFNQGIFSDSCLNSWKHKEVIFINTLHSCPFWEEEKFAKSTFLQLMKAENSAYKRFKLIFRYLLNKVEPGLSHPNIVGFYRDRIESVNYYVVLNNSYKKILENRLYNGFEKDNIKIIPNPLTIPHLDCKNKLRTVIYVGRLEAVQKKVDRLLRVWKMIQAEVPDWNLKIIGDGEERNKLEKKAEELKLERIEFLGRQVPDNYYMEASILCLTSNYEGTPMVITEAQSYGTIPIAFNCSEAMPELISNGRDGILVDPGKEKAFALELLGLINDDARRESMQKWAIEKVQRFDIKNIGQIWLSLMDN
jgi:glycosyltransferase involved in cell wall biosynthesis